MAIPSRLDSLEDEPDIERDPNYVTTAEAASMLGCDPQKLWRWAKKGKLSAPLSLSPRRRLWPLAEIEALGGEALPPEDEYTVSRTETASLLGVCPETVSRMVADSRLPPGRMRGGRLHFREKDIEAAIAQQEYDEKISLNDAARYLGIHWADIMRLKEHRGCFPEFHYPNQHFRRGEIIDWLERFKRTGSLCQKPEPDHWFSDVKSALRSKFCDQAAGGSHE